MHETAADLDSVSRERRNVMDAIEQERPYVEARREDLRNNLGLLAEDVGLLAGIGVEGQGPIEILNADAYTLAHVCERMAQLTGDELKRRIAAVEGKVKVR